LRFENIWIEISFWMKVQLEMSTLHERSSFFHLLSVKLLHSIIRIHGVLLVLSERYSDVTVASSMFARICEEVGFILDVRGFWLRLRAEMLDWPRKCSIVISSSRRLFGVVGRKEGLSDVLLSLLQPLLPPQLDGVNIGFLFHYSLELRLKVAALAGAHCLAPSGQHLFPFVSRLIYRSRAGVDFGVLVPESRVPDLGEEPHAFHIAFAALIAPHVVC